MESKNKRGRPPETDETKHKRQQLKQMFQNNSTKAFKELVRMIDETKDSNIKFKGLTYILDKCSPNTFYEDTAQTAEQNINIRLVSVNGKKIDKPNAEELQRIADGISEDEETSTGNSINDWEV